MTDTPYRSGYVCAYNLVVPGSNPKHTIYTFSAYILEIETAFVIGMKKDKKRPDWPIFKNYRHAEKHLILIASYGWNAL